MSQLGMTKWTSTIGGVGPAGLNSVSYSWVVSDLVTDTTVSDNSYWWGLESNAVWSEDVGACPSCGDACDFVLPLLGCPDSSAERLVEFLATVGSDGVADHSPDMNSAGSHYRSECRCCDGVGSAPSLISCAHLTGVSEVYLRWEMEICPERSEIGVVTGFLGACEVSVTDGVWLSHGMIKSVGETSAEEHCVVPGSWVAAD